MDQSNRKRKGLGKGKLVMMSLYRATPTKPPSPTNHHQYSSANGNNKVKPSPSGSGGPLPRNSVNQSNHLIAGPTSNQWGLAPPTSAAAACSSVEFIVKQEQVTPQPKQRVSILSLQDRDSYTNVDSLYGVAVDESVDIKASTYISSVRERFRLQVQPIN